MRSRRFAESPAFLEARPIWPEGREEERNVFVGFRAVVAPSGPHRVVVRLTASTLYRLSVNGGFAGYGPARGPHGYFRVDEWDVTSRLVPGRNVIAVEVAGYNVNSYYTIDAPSFLQAEVVSGDTVLAATGLEAGPFQAFVLRERVQKVQRYSFQRPFIEVYRLRPGHDAWKIDPGAAPDQVECGSRAGPRGLLPRRVPYPRFSKKHPLRQVSSGRIEAGIQVDRPWRDRSLVDIGPKLGGFPEAELEVVTSLELQTIASVSQASIERAYHPEEALRLARNSFRILDLGANRSGFLGATVRCQTPTRLCISFDEILSRGDVDFRRLECVNAVTYEVEPGLHKLESFEAYTLRYLKLMALEGECQVSHVYLREYANPDVWEAHFAASDPNLARLFEAGRETCAQNAVDLFMDCPSRERAGWLCDSFFTARVACDLSGSTSVERNFLENFLLPERFEFLPEGMLPMCYPADHNDGVFIPNWGLWFVLQLEEYLERSGDRATVNALQKRVLGLFDYFERFRNQEGLLEKLESWVFVEWSMANAFVQDVNYPSNMLYAAAMAAAGRLYGLPSFAQEAEKIRAVIRQQSFDGAFFVDNARREGGELRLTRNRSEVCQYFAFFFEIATPETHPALWETLCRDFGPHRKETGAFPEVHTANAFVGNMLRLESLSRCGRCQQLVDESLSYLLHMAEKTGTLWENLGSQASCNHGFASHIVHALYRDVVGLYRIDRVRKRVRLRFSGLELDWCEGRVPTAEGPISLCWSRKEGRLVYHLDVPAGYRVEVENPSGLVLEGSP